jgi:TolB-like protein/tetratricopeptide (TPR) repeat protein
MNTGNHASIELPFLRELKRRNVVRVALLYLAVCWLILEPVHVIFHMLEVPVWANRLVVILMAFGFPAVVLFAWVYEITPEGLKPTDEVPHGQSIRKQTGRRLDFAIIAVLALALVYFVVDKFWLSKHVVQAAEEHTSAPTNSSAIGEKSIAVLPFVDMSEKHDQEYFADGMAEEVLDLLAKLPGLRVVGRTSSFQFRGKSVDVRRIGDVLRVSYVLEGSVRRSGDQVRVTVQLLSAEDGAHRWSGTYDAKFDDVLKVQDAIASNLARSLEVAVGTMTAGDRRKETPEAYDLFMQGTQALDARSKEGCERAIGLFNRVLQLDPTSTRALISLARTYSVLGDEGWMLPKDAFGNAKRLALRALQADPNDATAHVILAYVHLEYDWDWLAAEREVDVASAIARPNAWALNVAARLASAQAQWPRAERLVREALASDPLDPDGYATLGTWIYEREGRHADAEAPLRRALQITPTSGTTRYFLAVCLLMQGRLEEALSEAQRELPEDGKYHVSSEVLYAMHRKQESDDALKQAIKESESEWPVSIAKVYAFRGEHDQAMAWLERAYEFHDEDLYFIKFDPQLQSLEADPRYKAFLRRMNLPE